MVHMVVKLLVFYLVAVPWTACEDTYSAVTVEYSPVEGPELGPRERVLKNVDAYLEILSEASTLKPDIVVFPEYGLHYKFGIMSRQYLLEVSTTVPSPDGHSRPHNGHLAILSRAAAEYRVYLVANLMERRKCTGVKCARDRFNLYNTNVVFDRNGALIARYRKFNLYHEYDTNITEKAEVVTFATDFGVTFGTLTCFDILHAHPTFDLLAAGVHHYVYPTLWFSKLMFLASLQVQHMWSYGNDVTLLAANVNYPFLGNGGSGIYVGRRRHTAYITGARRTTILHSLVPKTRNATTIPYESHISANMSNYNFKKESYTDYRTTVLQVPGTQRLCHEQCCLTLQTEATIKPKHTYRLVSYSGWKYFAPFGNRPFEVCALIACHDDSLQSCGERLSEESSSVQFKKISIEMTSMTVSNVLPNTMTTQYLPLQPQSFNYAEVAIDDDTMHKKLEAKHAIQDLMVFGLYSVAPSLDERSNYAAPQ